MSAQTGQSAIPSKPDGYVGGHLERAGRIAPDGLSYKIRPGNVAVGDRIAKHPTDPFRLVRAVQRVAGGTKLQIDTDQGRLTPGAGRTLWRRFERPIVQCEGCGKVRPLEGPLCPLCGDERHDEVDEQDVAESEWVY